MKLNERKELGRKFYEISIVDLSSSKFLFANQIFNNAIFSLQQSVEKTIKAVGLFYNIIEPNQLKSVNHSSATVYIKGLEKQFQDNILFRKNYRISGPLLNGMDQYDKIMADSVEELKEINEIGIHDLTIEELDQWINSMIGNKPNSEFNLTTISKEWLKGIGTILKESKIQNKFTNKSIEGVFEFDEQTKNDLVKTLEQQLQFTIANKTLLFLDILLSKHQNSSRYPCEHCGETPIVFYSVENPLVKRYTQLMNLTETSIVVIGKHMRN